MSFIATIDEIVVLSCSDNNKDAMIFFELVRLVKGMHERGEIDDKDIIVFSGLSQGFRCSIVKLFRLFSNVQLDRIIISVGTFLEKLSEEEICHE